MNVKMTISPDARAEQSKLAGPRTHRANFLLSEGFELHTFASIVDILNSTNNVLGRTAYCWEIFCEGDLDVRSSSGISIRADRRVEDASEPQSHGGRTVFVCGARSIKDPVEKSTKAWIRAEVRRGSKIAAFDSGAYVLASAGLLADQKCTLHWESIPHFAEDFGVHTDVVANIFVDLGRIATCAGGAAAADLAINIVAGHHGDDVANRVAEIAIMDRVRGPCDPQRLPFQSRFGQLNRHLSQAVRLMMDADDRTLAIDDIANELSLSRRQLERLFRAEFNITPAKYHMLMRLERAHLLLCDTNLPVVEVATACGFVSTSHFAKIYKDTYGMNPQATRTNARKAREGNLPRISGARISGVARYSLPQLRKVEAH